MSVRGLDAPIYQQIVEHKFVGVRPDPVMTCDAEPFLFWRLRLLALAPWEKGKIWKKTYFTDQSLRENFSKQIFLVEHISS